MKNLLRRLNDAFDRWFIRQMQKEFDYQKILMTESMSNCDCQKKE